MKTVNLIQNLSTHNYPPRFLSTAPVSLSVNPVHGPYNLRQTALDYLLGSRYGISKLGCWLWLNQVGVRDGYGFITVNLGLAKRFFAVHRLSFEYYTGKISRGAVVMHACDVRRCWNPKHLSVGSKQQNTQDMISKGRAPWQERQPEMATVVIGYGEPHRKISSLAAQVLDNDRQRFIDRKLTRKEL